MTPGIAVGVTDEPLKQPALPNDVPSPGLPGSTRNTRWPSRCSHNAAQTPTMPAPITPICRAPSAPMPAAISGPQSGARPSHSFKPLVRACPVGRQPADSLCGHPRLFLSVRCDSLRGCEYSRSEEHTSELQSRQYLVCRLLLEKNNILLNVL